MESDIPSDAQVSIPHSNVIVASGSSSSTSSYFNHIMTTLEASLVRQSQNMELINQQMERHDQNMARHQAAMLSQMERHHQNMARLQAVMLSQMEMLHATQVGTVISGRTERSSNTSTLSNNNDTRRASVTDLPTIYCDDTCSICLESMESGKEMRCKHVFHESCLDRWLVRRGTCPMCRS